MLIFFVVCYVQIIFFGEHPMDATFRVIPSQKFGRNITLSDIRPNLATCILFDPIFDVITLELDW